MTEDIDVEGSSIVAGKPHDHNHCQHVDLHAEWEKNNLRMYQERFITFVTCVGGKTYYELKRG